MKTARKVPANVVRCLDDNGPILYPSIGNPYRCETCGGGLKPGQGGEPGYHWDESYGYLVQVETEDDPRDTEEEIEDVYSALSVFADILGDGMTAFHVGGSFTCSEANRMAEALMVGGHKKAAMTFLEGHASGDDDEGDIHPDIEDFEAYVLELAGKPVPELIEEPEPKAPTKVVALAVVTTDELLKLMNLD
ncbi:hypothetical protein SEA_JANUS_72 [Streptomyces phage Janus]|uniref:Uncharacterized protein n=1 Tax=Streptomyces phage Janus TaxID=2510525 RepID=A0A411CQB1_9CAUD|nr:hypothetical protein KGG75_gp72 [Streptomyces phage Janus]ATI18935.1 hypothetical protein SEA_SQUEAKYCLEAN_72 [Streptomyces phage SqueakyClean]QAY15976.1 hypothetical protein SEA_JANUS_72 [Streptomyces phage Janus]QFG10739.1 hypothetical protein SEA_ANIMUS_71 [Streptomyces phage Animus]